MSDVVPFPNAKKRGKMRRKQSTLCRNGHHKWIVEKQTKFDVKEGKLVTIERCARCDETRRCLR